MAQTIFNTSPRVLQPAANGLEHVTLVYVQALTAQQIEHRLHVHLHEARRRHNYINSDDLVVVRKAKKLKNEQEEEEAEEEEEYEEDGGGGGGGGGDDGMLHVHMTNQSVPVFEPLSSVSSSFTPLYPPNAEEPPLATPLALPSVLAPLPLPSTFNPLPALGQQGIGQQHGH